MLLRLRYLGNIHVIDNIIDISEKGAYSRHEIVVKWERNLSIDISFNKLNPDEFIIESMRKGNKDYSSTSLRLQMRCFNNNNLIYEAMFGEEVIAGDGGDHWALILLPDIAIPEDLPLKNIIICDFKVIEPDVYLSKKYGVRQITLRKASL